MKTIPLFGFTPSQDILDSVPAAIFTEGHDASMVKYNKGITYGPFILNKREIFNTMGFIKNSGNDANGFGFNRVESLDKLR